MPHADWLISGQEKVILPTRENNVQKIFKLNLIIDGEHSPIELYCSGKTNDPNAEFWREDNAEQINSSKTVANIVLTALNGFISLRTVCCLSQHLYYNFNSIFFLCCIFIVLLLQLSTFDTCVYA